MHVPSVIGNFHRLVIFSHLVIWCESLRDLMNRFLEGHEKKKKKGRKKQNEMVLIDVS